MIDTDNTMMSDTRSNKVQPGKAMKIALIAVSSLALASGAALAAKPENAGKDKAKEKAGQYLKEEKVDRFSDKSGYGRGDDSSDDRSDDKSDDHSDDRSDDKSDDRSDDRSDDKSDDRSDDRSSDKKEKKGKRESMMEEHGGMDRDGYDGDKRGLEKQREMKMDQEQKELGKGSEKGQEMREQNSRKWWKFWGEE
ncbi:MAG: hypothetical protein V7721_08800 [Porticoccaceae bacterium]